MDYRSTMADDENPAGNSPWGSSPPASPRRNQSANYSSLGNEATYGGYESQDPSNGLQHDDFTTNAFARPNTASSTASTHEHNSSQHGDSSQQPESEQHGDNAGTAQQAGDEQSQSQEQTDAPVGQGQQQQQQARKSTYPQYKLQAKITGLERTGRKDPIMRFDVHVRMAGQSVRSEGKLD